MGQPLGSLKVAPLGFGDPFQESSKGIEGPNGGPLWRTSLGGPSLQP